MNILIPHSWLKDLVKTDAAPQTIAEKLSLCSLSVEKLHQREGDTVYEIEITPNRYDTLSVLGIAREVAAVLPRFGIKADLNPPEITDHLKTITDGARRATPSIALAKEGTELCPRFTALVLDNVEIKPSPKIIKDRLEMCGIRALNNVVDISNYLMLELGQPMHIFDFDKITDERGNWERGSTRKEMVLRESKKGEKLTTLDGVERKIPKGAIVIESGGKLIDLCGVMGGKNSEVDENTQRILLFIQIYDPPRIRKTSQELGLRTEASTRFEKGIDPAGILPAMNRAVEMLRKNAGAKAASPLLDIKNKQWEPHKVELEIPEVERLLGVRLEREEIIQILKSLGFEITIQNSGLQIPTIMAKVPSWRYEDIKIPADLIEEVARLHGYHNLPNLMPEGAIPPTPRDKKFYWEDKAKDFLKHQGFYEVCNYSFVSEEQILSNPNFTNSDHGRGSSLSRAIKVRNSLNTEMEYLRPSLLPSLMRNLAENQNRADEIKLFELERVYIPQKDQELPRENFRLTGLFYSHAAMQPSSHAFLVVKGIIKGLLGELGIRGLKLNPNSQNSATVGIWNPSGSETIGVGNVAVVGSKIVTFDLDFDAITKLASDKKTFEPIPEYPPIIEDLSIILPPKTYFADVVEEIKKQSQLVKNVELIDRYPEKGSVTLRLTYRHKGRTLTDDEVGAVRRKIIAALEKNLKARVRQKN